MKISRKIISIPALLILATFFTAFNTVSENLEKGIRISGFEAYMIDDVAFVSWMTTAEINDEIIVLEKSINGKKFLPVKKFKLSGVGSKYTFVDEKPSYGLSYYRIRHKHHKPLENVAHLINHDGPIHFEVSAKHKVIEIKADHRSDKTYLVSVSDHSGRHYFLESMVFNNTRPVKINLKDLDLKAQEYVVHLHSTEWSTDKIVSL